MLFIVLVNYARDPSLRRPTLSFLSEAKNLVGRLHSRMTRAGVVQFVKNPAVLFTFHRFYGIIQLIDKLEFDSTEVTNNELQNKKMGVV